MPQPFFSPSTYPRGVLRLSGTDRATFLQGLISNDIAKVSDRRGIWAALLTPQGKFLHDLFVTALDDTLLIEAEGARLADLRKRLATYRLRSKVGFEHASGFELWHGWGPGAAEAFGLAEPGDACPVEGGTVLLDPRLTELGIRVLLPQGTGAALLEAKGFRAAPWSEWDRLRLSLGVPDGSRDMELDKAILLENGFDELHGVDWAKGCYMGQELTARTKYRGLVKKRLVPVRIEGPLPAPGTIVTRPDGTEAGEIRSGADDRALALIRLDAMASGQPLSAGDARVLPEKPDWAQF